MCFIKCSSTVLLLVSQLLYEWLTNTNQDQNHFHRWPDVYLGLTTMGQNMSVPNLQRALSHALASWPSGTTSSSASSCNQPVITGELMVHPGYPSHPQVGGCGEGPDDFSQSADRQHELSTLRDPSLLELYSQKSVQLCAFKDLWLSTEVLKRQTCMCVCYTLGNHSESQFLDFFSVSETTASWMPMPTSQVAVYVHPCLCRLVNVVKNFSSSKYRVYFLAKWKLSVYWLVWSLWTLIWENCFITQYNDNHKLSISKNNDFVVDLCCISSNGQATINWIMLS